MSRLEMGRVFVAFSWYNGPPGAWAARFAERCLMIVPHMEITLEEIAALSDAVDFVLVPGFKNSGPEHWQSLWQKHSPHFQRIAQSHWDNPDIDLWVDATRRLLAERNRPAVLIGHSLGALASACLAGEGHPLVAGVMLVAMARPARFEAERRVPHQALGVPSVMVASQNDPLMRFSRAEYWSDLWGATLIDVGEAGHINAEAGYGLWWQGLDILSDFARTIIAHRSRQGAERSADRANG